MISFRSKPDIIRLAFQESTDTYKRKDFPVVTAVPTIMEERKLQVFKSEVLNKNPGLKEV
jgi:hypothetical protein